MEGALENIGWWSNVKNNTDKSNNAGKERSHKPPQCLQVLSVISLHKAVKLQYHRDESLVNKYAK